MRFRAPYLCLVAAALASALLSACQTPSTPPEVVVLMPGESGEVSYPVGVDFDTDIKPILEANCLTCHHPGSQVSGLSFASKTDIQAAMEDRQIIVPGFAERSSLFLVTVLPEYFVEAMPPEGHRVGQLESWLIYHWIQQGAKWPDGEKGKLEADSSASGGGDSNRSQPLSAALPPETSPAI